jgi:hypothetical protein
MKKHLTSYKDAKARLAGEGVEDANGEDRG